MCSRGSGIALPDCLLDELSLAFKNSFHSSIAKISYPTAQSQRVGNLSCEGPVTNALHPPGNEEMSPDLFHIEKL
jgi:hypothetical protein